MQPKATAPAAAPVAARRDLHHGEAAPPSRSYAKAQRGIDAWCVDYAKTITPEICNEIVDFTFIGRGEGALRREDSVLHVVNHTTYHREHVTAMLNQLDVQPQATDLPVFLRDTGSSLPK